MSNLHNDNEWTFAMKLRDLLETYDKKPQDVDLYHWDYDYEYPTMVELSLRDFTEKGLEEFRVALDMEVVRVNKEGENWVSVGVRGAHRSHVESLAMSHAGYCTSEEYEQWFTMEG